MKFRKKPVVIDAFQLVGDDPAPEWYQEACCLGIVEHSTGPGVIAINTLEGTMQANEGDWVIRGVKGEIYACKPDIFTMTYEPADQSP